jgi:cytochrome P450
MSNQTVMPIYLGRLRSLAALFGIASDPITATTRLHAAHGRFVILQYPHSRRAHPDILACISDPVLYRTVASDPKVWRTVNVGMRAFKQHASYRLSTSVTRLQGVQHAHYRQMLSRPLSKPSVAAMSEVMSVLAKRQAESWPRDQVTDFVPVTANLMQELAVDLLFGDDFERARPVASMIGYAAAAAWPFPGPAYFRWLRAAPKLERAINAWMDEKAGNLDPKDILSVLVNNPDEYGNAPNKAIVGSILVFTFGAAYETCQNALLWTLILLTQHPKIAANLADEIAGAVGDGPPSMDKISALPLLDGVTREGLRLFPPVPLQFRRSLMESELGGATIPAGKRVLTSAYLINRDPELYGEPRRFMPERWRNLERPAFEWPVFGAGPRMCPGSLFGLQMFKIALSAILSTHWIELAPHARIDHRSAITLTPYPNVPIILRKKRTATWSSPLAGSINDLVDLPAAS